MTQQYNFISVFCNKSTHTLEGLSLPPPKSCTDTSMGGCTRATHVRTDNIEFTSEDINKFSTERIWGNLFGKSSCRAASCGVWCSWNITTPAPGMGKLCLDHTALRTRGQKWAQCTFGETMKPLGTSYWGNFVKLHLDTRNSLWKEENVHLASLSKSPKQNPSIHPFSCISWPKPAAEVAS